MARNNIDTWKGPGYYRIVYRGGGQDFTSNGPVWFKSFKQYCLALEDAWDAASPTQVPYSVYLGVRAGAAGVV